MKEALRLLRDAESILAAIKPSLDDAYRYGQAEGLIRCAINHLEVENENR